MGTTAATAVPTPTPQVRMQSLAPALTSSTSRRRGSARLALIEAAARLLPQRAPGAITGRELADEARVNYGLVHHHFGGKDEALAAGLGALRDDFVRMHGDGASLPLLTGECHPYLRALVRSQVDYPDRVAPSSDFPIGTMLVNAVAPRVAERSGTDLASASAEAKARVIAMISIQLCYGVFSAALLDGTGVGHRERAQVELELASLYDALALVEPST